MIKYGAQTDGTLDDVFSKGKEDPTSFKYSRYSKSQKTLQTPIKLEEKKQEDDQEAND